MAQLYWHFGFQWSMRICNKNNNLAKLVLGVHNMAYADSMEHATEARLRQQLATFLDSNMLWSEL
jgi:hypothetical protein